MSKDSYTVSAEDEGTRIDRWIASHAGGASRAEVQRWLRDGRVRVGGHVVKQPAYRTRHGEEVEWEPPTLNLLTPASLPLHILYEDEDLLAVDKPPGLVVHPGAGTRGTPTLVEALLAARDLPASDDPSRPGIVHRLDKETSGVLVVAKTQAALASLRDQFARRAIEKTYLAVLGGVIVEDEGWIDAPIGRDPRAPRRMAVEAAGRRAETGFRVLRRGPAETVVLVTPKTGRTHQIRVHFRYIGHPVLGDALYGGPKADRLLLHAWTLSVTHPRSAERLAFESPPPAAVFDPADYGPARPSRRAAR
ncbi:MAG: RluA family pseudouridine synthase [Candidatus Bipolaricaulota bacterium]